MANYSHTVKKEYDSGDRQIKKDYTVTADQRVGESEVAVPGSTTDKQINIAIDVDQIKSLWISADQDLTIETNDGSAPDDTIALKADKPVQWDPDSPFSCPLTVDVTAIYVTNAGSDEAALDIEVLQDSTP